MQVINYALAVINGLIGLLCLHASVFNRGEVSTVVAGMGALFLLNAVQLVASARKVASAARLLGAAEGR